MSEHAYLMTIGLPLVTVLLVYAMKYFSAVQQAKARLANDEAYRELAQRAAATQAESAAVLASVQATLADVKGRLSLIEKILKEVE